jgi:hypothetical protein
MRQCLAHTGFEQVYSQSERQYASFGRIAGYLKFKAILRALRGIGLENVTIPLIAPGTVFAICRRTPYSIRRRLSDPHFVVAPPMRAASIRKPRFSLRPHLANGLENNHIAAAGEVSASFLR